MNRKEFMDRLEQLLTGIPEDERKDALKYYTDYFDDAGVENESHVICELGSPEKVAATIKADIRGNGRDSGEFTEHGYTDSRFEEKERPGAPEHAYKQAGTGYTYNTTNTTQGGSGDTYNSARRDAGEYNSTERDAGYTYNSKQTDTGYTYQSTQTDGYESGPWEYESGGPGKGRAGKIVLVILLLLVALPFALPISIGGIVLVITVMFAVFGLFAGLVMGAAALTVTGVIIFGFGLTKLVAALPAALLISGCGLLVFILGLAATVGTFKLCTVVYPAMCRLIINICRLPFHRRAVS